jgi:Rieske Fe-S protein
MNRKQVSSISRREVLSKLLGALWIVPTALGLGQILRFMRFEPPANKTTRFALGTTGSLPRLPAYIESGQIWLHRDEGGYFALDAICTHLGCTVDYDGSVEYSCRCHGSRFAEDGSVLQGPATRALSYLRLYWEGGRLMVNRDEQVSGTFRLSG